MIADSIVFALNDAMWKKYRIGSVMKLADRAGIIVNYNYSVRPASNLDVDADPSDLRSVYHDYSSAALLHRGALLGLPQRYCRGFATFRCDQRHLVTN